MRKDLFLVGARLLGVLQFLSAASPLGYLLASWFGIAWIPASSQGYNGIQAAVHLAAGSYLVYRPLHLYRLLENLKHENDDAEDAAPEPTA
jgi:hypothetical protein